jgi:hypothetical protein
MSASDTHWVCCSRSPLCRSHCLRASGDAYGDACASARPADAHPRRRCELGDLERVNKEIPPLCRYKGIRGARGSPALRGRRFVECSRFLWPPPPHRRQLLLLLLPILFKDTVLFMV